MILDMLNSYYQDKQTSVVFDSAATVVLAYIVINLFCNMVQ